MRKQLVCHACGADGVETFYEVLGVPAHSVLLMRTRREALDYPTGDIVLGVCRCCGFIANVCFDPALHEYSERYEETQGFSPTFNAFHLRLADRLIERYDLHDKDIVEIGCGKGEFLALLCERGGNRGLGIDPSYVAERAPEGTGSRVRFINEFYSERHASEPADLVCCKMTLEHISDVAAFVGRIGRSLARATDTVVFFQVPDAGRILRETAFWDVYYEHCSYFTGGSLARLFRASGFAIRHVETEYDEQYLTLEARPGSDDAHARLPAEDDAETVVTAAERYGEQSRRVLADWKRRLAELAAENRRVVIWGGGSKGVAFLTTLGLGDEIDCAVDINPYKQGFFMPGTGHEVVAPSALRERRPDVVIIMNPIYRDEVARGLAALDVDAELVTV
jgi:SAM-dependent methyltransferase